MLRFQSIHGYAFEISTDRSDKGCSDVWSSAPLERTVMPQSLSKLLTGRSVDYPKFAQSCGGNKRHVPYRILFA